MTSSFRISYPREYSSGWIDESKPVIAVLAQTVAKCSPTEGPLAISAPEKKKRVSSLEISFPYYVRGTLGDKERFSKSGKMGVEVKGSRLFEAACSSRTRT